MGPGEPIPEMGRSLADLLADLGNVPAWRIPLRPPPGTATEKDLIAWRKTPERWLFELADRTLILKPPGLAQSVVAGAVSSRVQRYVHERHLGVGLAASAWYRLREGLVRSPAFSFVSWERLPGGKVPDVEIANFVPDLVVELPRAGHTDQEITRKLREYFEAGVRMAWLIRYPEKTGTVFLSPTDVEPVAESGALSGGDLFPGLRVPLASLFEPLSSRRGPK
jgi:Uma2 family endonuclease